MARESRGHGGHVPFEPDDAEVQREDCGAGSIIGFKQDPEIPKDEAWLDVVSPSGEKPCDIPWYVADKINEGRKVWEEVTDAKHSTIDAGPDNARIHSIEFGIFYR